MYCAECGEPMSRRPDGAWHGCCNRLGYWHEGVPQMQDYRLLGYAGPGAMRHVHLDDSTPPLFFYPTGKWPRGKEPVAPRQ